MIPKPVDILEQFPVRKNRKQKEAFRTAVQSYARELGYAVATEQGSMGSRNLIIGDPEGADYLVTAHYDTPATIGIPNLITPCSFILYLLYQIFAVGLLVIVSIAAGVALGLLFHSPKVAGLLGLAVYWGLLLAMRFGIANRNNYNDNTSGVVTLLEIARTLPENHRHKVCFVLFDLEEWGMVGSGSYQKAHKEQTGNQIILNMDCVGDGDQILLIPTKKLKQDKSKLNPLYTCCGQFGKKFISIRDKGYAVYPSDQNRFPYGVAICALRKGKLALYMSKIHTSKDTNLDVTNVNLLRAALTTYITTT